MSVPGVGSPQEYDQQRGAQFSARNNAEEIKTQFLTLLVAQLKNQDPMNPVENQDFVAQLAQFSSLEQLISINEGVEGLGKTATESLTAQGPRLGVETQPLTEQIAELLGISNTKGALISSVLGGSVSDGKLMAGDVVISVNGREVTSPADLTNFIREASEETGAATIKVIRDKTEVTVGVNLAWWV